MFGYPRTIFVPIDVPAMYDRILRSAAKRALGPSTDMRERSGVEFELRTIGGRKIEEAHEEGEEEVKARGRVKIPSVESVAPDS